MNRQKLLWLGVLVLTAFGTTCQQKVARKRDRKPVTFTGLFQFLLTPWPGVRHEPS